MSRLFSKCNGHEVRGDYGVSVRSGSQISNRYSPCVIVQFTMIVLLIVIMLDLELWMGAQVAIINVYIVFLCSKAKAKVEVLLEIGVIVGTIYVERRI